MDVKFILPALLEATDPGFRPIKYALFPPLGLAALAGYLDADDQASLEDEHVMPLHLDDDPDLVVMSVYITSARRAYEIADGYRRRGLEPLWDVVIRAKRVNAMLPLLEGTLDAYGRARRGRRERPESPGARAGVLTDLGDRDLG
jgi:hypothetical protein